MERGARPWLVFTTMTSILCPCPPTRPLQIDIAEDFCVNIVVNVVTVNGEIMDEVLATRFPELNVSSFEELDAALPSCWRSSSPEPDGITYVALCRLGEDGGARFL